MAIPRIKIHLTFREISSFIFTLFTSRSGREAGDIIGRFETRFAGRYNYPQAVVFSKARMAFFHILKGLKLKPDSEIIISGIHVADFVNMIRLAGFTPVVVDVSPVNYGLDFEDLKNKIGKKTGLLLVTHLCGFPTDMDRLSRICSEAGVRFVEDCSQAVCASWKGKPLGTFGIAGIFSLSLAKPVCTMSGGIVISNDMALLQGLRTAASGHGNMPRLMLSAEAVKNIVIKIATSRFFFKALIFPLIRIFSKPADFFSRFQKTNKTVTLRTSLPGHFHKSFTWQQARLGIKQLDKLDEQESVRRENGRYLYEHLHDTPLFRKPEIADIDGAAFWLFPLLSTDSSRMKSVLSGKNIDSSGHLLSCLSEEEAFRDLNFQTTGSKLLKKNTIFLPMYPAIKKKELNHMINVLNSIR